MNMKRLSIVVLTITVLICALLLNIGLVNAAENLTTITGVTNPGQKIGLQIGDVLTRKVRVLANSPEKITPKTLPVKSTRTNGIELTGVNVSLQTEKEQTQYMIELRYQVFTHSTQPAKMYLPKEVITLIDGEDLTLPAWSFWYSPLVISDLDNAKTTVLPQAKISLIDQQNNMLGFFAFVGLFLLGCIGLVYINVDRYWLPFMGGGFARAHRKIKALAKKSPAGTETPKAALGILHEAFNQLFGRGLYPNKIEEFLANHPKFKQLRAEIESFFELSNQTLFAGINNDSAQVMKKVMLTSKQLRDCERGV